MTQITKTDELKLNEKKFYKLRIKNLTDETLEVDYSNVEHGIWNTNGKKKRKPVKIEPSSDFVEALRINGRDTNWRFKCQCTWKTKKLGSIMIQAHYPHKKKYIQVSMELSGTLLQITEFKNLISGANYSEDLTIFEIEPDKVDEIISWESIKALNHDRETLNKLPAEYNYPPEEKFIGRTEKNIISKSNWEYIKDKKYVSQEQKEYYIEEYFSVVVYSINTDTKATKAIPAGASTSSTNIIEVSTYIKEVLEKNQSIRACIGIELKGKVANFKAELEGTYGIKDISEESTNIYNHNEDTIEIRAVEDIDRMYVPWVISKTLIIYRKLKEKGYSVVAISEWVDEKFDKIYPYGN